MSRMSSCSDIENEKKNTGIPFRKLSFDNFRRKISSEKMPDYYSAAEVDEECVVVTEPIVPTTTIAATVQYTILATHSSRLSSSLTPEPCSSDSATYSSSNSPAVWSPSHTRSQSDGCQSLQTNTSNRLSAYSHYGMHASLYNSTEDNQMSCFNADLYYGANITDVHTPSGELQFHSYDDAVTTAAELDHTNDDRESSTSSSIESRFPRPKPGESLESFLHSAEFYKNCGVLDRENAHFYIAEAIMAAFEQMSFETDCRAAGLLDDLCEDSDEEIQSLQHRIREKRQQKRSKQGTTTAATVVSSTSVAAASTTDYSVYSSPLSSTHTESSEALSDTELSTRSPGVSARHRGYGACARTRRGKTLKRSSLRSNRDLGVSSSFSANDDESDVNTNTGSGSSCCTLSNVDTGACNTSDTASSRQQQHSTTSVATCERHATQQQTMPQPSSETETHPSTRHCCGECSDGNCRQKLLESNTTSNSSSSRSCGRETSAGAAKSGGGAADDSDVLTLSGRRVPDHRTAEGIGLRLLQRLATPQHQLPKASELQWLVSERDAPQKLLPLPSSSVPHNSSSSEPVLLRGTNDWAPPREQLILTLIKENKRSTVLSRQNYRCAGCGQQVSPCLSKHYRLCHYFMRYFCATCHMNQAHYIPAKVLHQWDAKQFTVSCFAHQLLTRLYPEPLLYPSSINSTLYSNSKNLNQFRLFRVQLYHCLPYINTCSRAQRERSILRDSCPVHWSSDKELVSLRELVSVKAGSAAGKGNTAGVLYTLQMLTGMCLDHVAKCQTCQGRGFICEVCFSERAIFPFELATVRVCDACGACTHYRCPLQQCGRCLLRKRKRSLPHYSSHRNKVVDKASRTARTSITSSSHREDPHSTTTLPADTDSSTTGDTTSSKFAISSNFTGTSVEVSGNDVSDAATVNVEHATAAQDDTALVCSEQFVDLGENLDPVPNDNRVI
uniref:Run domain Beclin-1-interacting and cysteine-rich domain-containing protein-like n=2 Tax=Hirondellea gigas TaxID=1518452 RepID=A0A6A7FWU3_9CRUS